MTADDCGIAECVPAALRSPPVAPAQDWRDPPDPSSCPEPTDSRQYDRAERRDGRLLHRETIRQPDQPVRQHRRAGHVTPGGADAERLCTRSGQGEHHAAAHETKISAGLVGRPRAESTRCRSAFRVCKGQFLCRLVYVAGHSQAAPRTPDESPCLFLTIGVVTTSLKTCGPISRGSSV